MAYNYKKLYEKTAKFYQERKKAKKALFFCNLAFTGLFFVAYGVFALYALFSYDLKDIVKILALPALCLGLVMVLRIFIKRPRPYSEKGANITPLLQKSGSEFKSFPSRHIACAFVIAVVILAYCTGAGICLLLFGGILSYIRFALGVHYPSDLFAGAVLGVACGIFAFIL